jgi:glycosyltransferase involved in cell wall biosynthesis
MLQISNAPRPVSWKVPCRRGSCPRAISTRPNVTTPGLSEQQKENQMISIVMPSYNSATFIRQAIESVLFQTYPHFELLVCDDGSTDETQNIVRDMARSDNRIRLIVNQHGGVSRNCNVGLNAARYPWIARLDADDVAFPERLETQIKAAECNPEVVCWGGGARLINRLDRQFHSVQLGPATEQEFRLLKQSGRVIYIVGATVMFRREDAVAVGGYDPRFDGGEDVELLSRLARRGSLRTIPREISFYRIHGSSGTAKRSSHQRHLFTFIAERNRAWLEGQDIDLGEYFSALESRPIYTRLRDSVAGRGNQLYRNAGIHFAEGRLLSAAGAVACSLLLRPTMLSQRLGRLVHGRLRASYDYQGSSARSERLVVNTGSEKHLG